ncbi:putative dispersed gene family protein 1 (DGF-1) [Trypanosoma cruzi]|nr:putative dispersed gene family protein 1 (DGF-1) [Trypanosoma cruzi]
MPHGECCWPIPLLSVLLGESEGLVHRRLSALLAHHRRQSVSTPRRAVVVWGCVGGGRAMVSLTLLRLRGFASAAVLWWGLCMTGCLCVSLYLVTVVAAVFYSFFLSVQLEILWLCQHNYRFKVLRINCSIRIGGTGISIWRNRVTGFAICRKGFDRQEEWSTGRERHNATALLIRV